MKYARHRSSFSQRPPTSKRKWLGVFIILLGVCFVLYSAFSLKKNRNEVADIDAPSIFGEDIELGDSPQLWGDKRGADESDYEQIELFPVAGFEGSGIGRRGSADNLFTQVVIADLPAIDTSVQFYEGWLVKPGVTDFFSTGEMFVRDDGKWGLVWEADLDTADSDLLEYSKVIITLEDRDGDPAPSADHIIEGEF